MSRNLSDTTPAAPAGGVNVKFQEDVSGNTSAYVPLGGVGSKQTVVPVAGVVTIDASLGNSYFVNITAVVTAVNIINMVDGQELTILFAQDGTGHAVTTNSHILGNYTITTTASKHSCYKWSYNAADNNWYQIGSNNM